jgi:hypothetical protein
MDIFFVAMIFITSKFNHHTNLFITRHNEEQSFSATLRDRFAGTPIYRYVRCRKV